MPILLSRDEALTRMRQERSGPACLMCAVHQRCAGPVYTLHEDDEFIILLPRYVRRWGHVLVSLQQHVQRFEEVAPRVWLKANLYALQAARMIEQVLAPRRVYVTSTGSSNGELTQSSQHMHLHVIPVPESEDRPADIFSWQAGVYTAEHDEWQALKELYQPVWDHLSSDFTGQLADQLIAPAPGAAQ